MSKNFRQRQAIEPSYLPVWLFCAVNSWNSRASMFLSWWHLGCNYRWRRASPRFVWSPSDFEKPFLKHRVMFDANMIQDVSKMHGIKILEVLLMSFLWLFILLKMCLLVHHHFGIWVYPGLWSTIGDSGNCAVQVTCFGNLCTSSSNHRFFCSQNFDLRFCFRVGCFGTSATSQWVWWFRFAANAQNLEPTRGHRSDVSGTVTRSIEMIEGGRRIEGSRWNNWETRSRV